MLKIALRKYVHDQNGHFAILTALFFSMLVGGGALALDIAAAVSARSHLTSAADAAVLAGTRQATALKAQGDAAWKAKAEAYARSVFSGNAGQRYETATLNVAIDLLGGGIVGNADFTYQDPGFLGGFVGLRKVTVARAVQASVGSGFIDVTFLVDNSMSMGIGATSADQDKMLTNAQCAFACHTPRSSTRQQRWPSGQRAAGATLRIDVVKQSLKSIMADLKAMDLGDRVRISIYTFGSNVAPVVENSIDADSISAAIDTIDLETGRDSTKAYGGSLIAKALDTVATRLGASGDGSTTSRRQSFVVLFTDGIEDSSAHTLVTPYKDGFFDFNLSRSTPTAEAQKTMKKMTSDGSYLGPFSGAACDALKRNGHIIYTVQTNYETPKISGTDNPSKDKLDLINGKSAINGGNLMPQVATAFSRCASGPSYQMIAETSTQIPSRLKATFASIAQSSILRLTN